MRFLPQGTQLCWWFGPQSNLTYVYIGDAFEAVLGYIWRCHASGEVVPIRVSGMKAKLNRFLWTVYDMIKIFESHGYRVAESSILFAQFMSEI